MKNLKLFLILIVPILLMSSKCIDKNKNDADNFQILKGRLMVDCNTPYASSLVQLRSVQYGFGGLAYCEDINGNTEFYTDENGYFEINYRKIGSEGIIYAPYEVMKSIPLGEKSLDMGEVNLSGKVNFVIKLEVNNSYTANDTLVFRDFSGASAFDEIRIPGPFQSGVIDTVLNEPYTYPLRYDMYPTFGVLYAFRPYVADAWGESSRIKPVFCNLNLQEAICVIN